MPVFKIHHVTKYEYDRPVRESVNEIRLYPHPGSGQETLSHSLLITHNPEVSLYVDYWGNTSGVFNLLVPHRELTVESRTVVRTLGSGVERIPFDSLLREIPSAGKEGFSLLELSSPRSVKNADALRDLLSGLPGGETSVAQTVKECSDLVFSTFTYRKGITDVETTVDEILERKEGVCQDFAHVMLELLRTRGIPCRYTSGYVCPNKTGMRGEGATHAWVEAFIPRYGWAGIDPTNNVWVTDKHVRLAVGRDFGDCTPVKGTFRGPAKESLSVYVSVSYEDGQTFDELTRVQLRRERELPSQIEDALAGQQQ